MTLLIGVCFVMPCKTILMYCKTILNLEETRFLDWYQKSEPCFSGLMIQKAFKMDFSSIKEEQLLSYNEHKI